MELLENPQQIDQIDQADFRTMKMLRAWINVMKDKDPKVYKTDIKADQARFNKYKNKVLISCELS